MNSSLYNRNHWLARAEMLVWAVFLFSFAFQRRLIFYQATWDFREWLSFSLYETDILFLFVLVLSLLCYPRWFVARVHKFEYFLGGFMAMSALSIAVSSYPIVSAFALLRLGEFVLLYWYITRYALVHFNIVQSSIVLVGGILFQAVIAIGQFFVQHDLGLRIVGESVLDPFMQGVASFFLANGEKVMRAYGTTPHPNILAAYLLVGLVMVCVLFLQYGTTQARKDLFLMGYGILLWAFALTFSRTLIALWVLIMIVGFIVLWRRGGSVRKALVAVLGATLVYGALLIVSYWPEAVSRITISGQEEAVQLRLFYNGQAFSSGGDVVNWLGVGAGNFVGWLMEYQPNLARYLYQPVHNIYLLIYSEVGIIGIAFFLAFLGSLKFAFLKRRIRSLPAQAAFLVWVAMLAAGLFDHFPWTLQQGRFLLWSATAVVSFCTYGRHEIL